MDKQEWEDKRNALLKRHKAELFGLDRRYALFNNSLEIGSIATDAGGSIKIDSIEVTTDIHGVPQCVYRGFVLKKVGEARGVVLQRHLL